MSLKGKTISGVKWTTVSTVTLAVVGLIKISVLARFLDAEDFGLMALVTFVLGFMDLFMDMGLTSAILHKQDITDKEYASLYWINVIFSLLLFGIISLVSPAIAGFYDEPELTILIPLMAISIMLSALGRQFKTVEQKHLNFRYIALTDIAGAAVGLIVGILYAVWGYGVYALVYAALTHDAISNAVYFIRGLRDRGMMIHFKYREAKPFLKIGIYQVGGQIVNYFNRDLDILLIGKFLGSEVLGGYSLAKQLVKKPMSILNPIITKVASPVLSLVQDDQQKLREKFLSFLNLVSTANVMVYLLVAICAYPLVYVLYGESFLNIVVVVQILSAYMYFRSIGNPMGGLIIATGRTDLGFYWNLIVLAIMPAAIYIGALFSIEAIALSLSLTMLCLTLLAWRFIIFRITGSSFKKYLLNLVPDLKRLYRIILRELSTS
ncbi:polysaccharide transporter, PST family/teichuronic acid exporter [Fodinibius roseus]|uniref:Polysaccharide transporter, PST family/teichuronic acid exporter n=1 Tax=Fodinibius roseus TaxID=1194090 RepID=A0A1M5F0N6_9BACT|nr:MOP flippase family protein [Fodinibius roseus]SHF85006.1 polysaccharide transporter, PST family/teichuronic acid exporter [Fodinibius roseus]